MTAYEFYRDRLRACPSYGFIQGHELLCMVTRCAFWDSSLTLDEFNSIIKLADEAHIKMVEANYNEGWHE